MATAHPPRVFVPSLLSIFLAFGVTGSARADVRVLGPDEVLSDWTVRIDGTTFLEFDGGRWELITDPASPEVSQLGDGSFHAMSLREIRRALEELGPATLRLDGTIVVLPYPRRGSLKSSCERETIFLSPGIREVQPAHVHSTVAHEVGHLLQHERAASGSIPWSEYLDLRALPANPQLSANAAHRDRPDEIFAEDFRILIGGPLASATAPHENGDLTPPRQVPGLDRWLTGLVEGVIHERTDAPAPRSFPNPFQARTDGLLEVRFLITRESPGVATGDIYDVGGRRVRTLAGSAPDPGTRVFRWDGRDAAGLHVGSGFYFVRWRENPAAGAARVQVLR